MIIFEDSQKKAFHRLFGIIQEIINFDEWKISSNYKYFHNFVKIFDELSEIEIYRMVDKLYDIHVSKIDANDESWISEDEPFLGVGRMGIYLGEFFNDAALYKHIAEEDLEGLPECAYEERPEIKYPSILKLCVYHIFYIHHKDDESGVRLKIRNVMDEIERDLNIKSNNNRDWLSFIPESITTYMFNTILVGPEPISLSN